MTHRHKQIKLQPNQPAVDEGIAELLGLIWKAGISTTLSCEENHPGIMWIQFASLEHGQSFLQIIARSAGFSSNPDSLYNRLCGDNTPVSLPKWEYSTHICDEANSELFNHHVRPPNLPKIRSLFSVRFPIDDYPILVEIMKEHNHPAVPMAVAG